MSEIREVVITSACRTPVGSFGGSLSSLSAPQLGSIAVAEAVKRSGLDNDQIDEVIMGCVLSAGMGQARESKLGTDSLPRRSRVEHNWHLKHISRHGLSYC